MFEDAEKRGLASMKTGEHYRPWGGNVREDEMEV